MMNLTPDDYNAIKAQVDAVDEHLSAIPDEQLG